MHQYLSDSITNRVWDKIAMYYEKKKRLTLYFIPYMEKTYWSK